MKVTLDAADTSLTVSVSGASITIQPTGQVAAVLADGTTQTLSLAVNAPQVIPLATVPWVGTPTSGWGPVELNMSNGEQAAGDGHPITLRGHAYATGFGCHAESRINFALGGAASKLTVDVGIDDETKGAGAAGFAILGDGKVLADAGVLTGTSPVQTLSVDLTGVQTLTLHVYPAPAGVSYAHADWAAPLLTLAPGKTLPTNTTTSPPVAPPSTPPPVPAAPMILGINVEGPSDYSYPIFADCFRQARGFGDFGGGWGNVGKQPLAADGYPISNFGVVMITNGAPGVYQFRCTGNPTITFDGDQPGRSFAYDAATNQTTGTVTIDHLGQTCNMSFKQSPDPAKQVTKIEMLRPGGTWAALDGGQLYADDFLSKVKLYPVLRFMDWDGVNGNTSDGFDAAALKQQIDLCNAVRVGGWFNASIADTDATLADFVKQLTVGMGSTLPIYIEDSNEIWNVAFKQNAYEYQRAQDIANATSPDPVALAEVDFGFPDAASANKWPWSEEQNEVARDMIHFATTVKAAAAGDKRVKVVLAGQCASAPTTDSALKLCQKFAGDPKNYYDVLACAPYVQLPDDVNKLTTLTTAQVFAGLWTYLTTKVVPWCQSWQALAAKWGIPLVAYECGVDVINCQTPGAALAAYSDPRWRDLTLMLLTLMESSGFTLANYYHLSGYVSQYGTDPLIRDDAPSVVTPAMLAVQDFQAGKRLAIPAANPWQ